MTENAAVFPRVLSAKPKNLGDGFVVRRALPSVNARAVGPFIFLDEMGPAHFGPGHGLDVRPHPHIGLATVTYLFAGAIEHRDSLGTVQVIRPGDVNWMTAGRGIVHSERSPSPRTGDALHGVQFWVALPAGDEEAPPSFHHTPAAALPEGAMAGARARVIIGALGDLISPVKTFAPTLFVDLTLEADSAWPIAGEAEELALYVVSGGVRVDGALIQAGQLGVLRPQRSTRLEAVAPSRGVLFGGAKLDGPRKLWWNFVSTRAERIEQAKADWRAQTLGQVPGETEFIPLPEA